VRTLQPHNHKSADEELRRSDVKTPLRKAQIIDSRRKSLKGRTLKLQAWSDAIRTEPQKREGSNTLVTEVKALWEGRMTKKERGRGEVVCDHKKCQRILTTKRPGARPLEGDEESITVKLSRRKTSVSRKHGTIELA
jgi:hypothetical protein